MLEYVSKIIFFEDYTAFIESIDERRAVNGIYFEKMVSKTFRNCKEYRIGELITTNFHIELLNNELLQHRVLHPSFKTAVNRKMHVALASSPWPKHYRRPSPGWPERKPVATYLWQRWLQSPFPNASATLCCLENPFEASPLNSSFFSSSKRPLQALPHVHANIAGMPATEAITAHENLQMEGTPLRTEIITFINDALRHFLAKTVIGTLSHVYDPFERLLRTLATLVSTARSTVTLIKETHMTSHLTTESGRQYNPRSPLFSNSTTYRHNPCVSTDIAHMRHAQALQSQHVPILTFIAQPSSTRNTLAVTRRPQIIANHRRHSHSRRLSAHRTSCSDNRSSDLSRIMDWLGIGSLFSLRFWRIDIMRQEETQL